MIPYPGMDFTAFTTLPAADLDKIVANIESLAVGTGLADASITPEKLVAGTGTTWTPQTFTSTSVGVTLGTGGSITAKYIQIGKTVVAWYDMVLGTSGALTNAASFTLPVTAATLPSTLVARGSGIADLPGSATYPVFPRLLTTTTVGVHSNNTASDTRLVTIAPTKPFTWANSATLSFFIIYRAA